MTSVMQNVIVEIVFLKGAVTYLTCTKCILFDVLFGLPYNIKVIIYVRKDNLLTLKIRIPRILLPSSG